VAVAVDSSTPSRWSAFLAPAATMDSASFTAPANSFLVLTIECDGNDDLEYTNGFATPSVSLSTGTALTWTKRVERTWSEATQGGQSVIWTAPAVTSEARVVRVTKDINSISTRRTSAKLYVVTGVDLAGTPVDTVGASNEGGSTTNDIATTSITPGANGMLFVADTDWTQKGVFTSSDLTIDTADYAGEISVCSGYKTCTSGAGVTADLNAAGTLAVQHKWCQIVVREAGTAGSAAARPSYTAFPKAGMRSQGVNA
jgi:hypothetical protein